MGSGLTLCLDFDGTVVRPDTVRLLAELGMGPLRARRLARDVDRGRVPVTEALERMIGSVTTTWDVALGFLVARARVDPGLPALLDWARRAGADVKVLSAGLEPVIRHFLGPLADRVAIVANDLAVDPPAAGAPVGRWRVVFREPGPVEAAKRRAVEAALAAGRAVAYVGDGRGDRDAAALVAVAGRARGPTLGSLVFARDALAEALAAAGLAFTPFETLHDVRRALESAGGPDGGSS